MEDYYTMVGVDRSASGEEIDRAIRAELRLWQRRTASPDLARRQEAERRVHELGQARTVLLDHHQRHRYDLQLSTSPVPALSPPRSSPPVRAVPARPNSPARPVPAPAPRGSQRASPEAVRSPPPGTPALPEPGQGTDTAVWRPPPQHAWWAFVMVVPPPILAVGMIVQGSQGSAAALALVLALFVLGLAPLPLYLRYRRRRVVLDATGVTLRTGTTRHIPWAEVRSIQPVTVGSTLRVEIRTQDGGRTLAPAPVGFHTVVNDRRFAYQVAVMQRWHAYYTSGPGAVRG